MPVGKLVGRVWVEDKPVQHATGPPHSLCLTSWKGASVTPLGTQVCRAQNRRVPCPLKAPSANKHLSGTLGLLHNEFVLGVGELFMPINAILKFC